MNIKKGKYRHFKGNEYLVEDDARHSETLEELVLYRALYESPEYGKEALWARPASMWNETITRDGYSGPRFAFVEPSVDSRVQVGVGVFVRKKGKILFGKRKGSHGSGTWELPGGKLEFGEEIEDCAIREVKEEVNLTVTNPRIARITNDIFIQDHKHFITIFVVCDYKYGVLKNMEPDKSETWEWHTWDNPPQPLMLPIVNLRKQKFNPITF